MEYPKYTWKDKIFDTFIYGAILGAVVYTGYHAYCVINTAVDGYHQSPVKHSIKLIHYKSPVPASDVRQHE